MDTHRQHRDSKHNASRASQSWLNTGLALTALMLVVAFGAERRLEERSRDTQRMLDPSVSLRTIGHVSVDHVGDSVWTEGSGSGVLISTENCEVWTNYHVIKDAALVEVLPRGLKGPGTKAEVVSFSPRIDLAVLRLARCDGMRAAQLGDSSRLRPGDETYAVGNPLGRNPDSVSRGIVSHTERYAHGAVPYLQTDAAINPGNSGGALFNADGEVIGINTAIASRGDSRNVGVGYAIPINLAREEALRLRTAGPRWGYAGIEEDLSTLPASEAVLFGAPQDTAGVILSVEPESGPAAGKLEARDLIYRIDSTPVSSSEQALRLIASREPDTDIDLHLIRAGATMAVTLRLDNGWKDEQAHRADEYEGHLGLTLEMWNEEEEGGFQRFDSPVITHVQSMGPGHRARIMSTQRGMFVRGPYQKRYLLDAKVITGVVYAGRYCAVQDIETVEKVAAEASATGEPVLLEVAYWMRDDPKDLSQSLKRVHTSFVRVDPARWSPTGHDQPQPELAVKEDSASSVKAGV
ncbi:MAG: S1C family serine protease [Gammaproteobacteria bacterium]